MITPVYIENLIKEKGTNVSTFIDGLPAKVTFDWRRKGCILVVFEGYEAITTEEELKNGKTVNAHLKPGATFYGWKIKKRLFSLNDGSVFYETESPNLGIYILSAFEMIKRNIGISSQPEKIIELRKKNIGRTNCNKAGEKYEIIEYRTSRDIDIKFEDGTIRKHISMSRFLLGAGKDDSIYSSYTDIASLRIGEEVIAKNGKKMKLVGYRNSKDIDVLVEGKIYHMSSYYDFHNGACPKGALPIRPAKEKPVAKEGYEEKRKSRLGMRIRNTQGLWATVTKYQDAKHVELTFDNGYVANDKYWNRVKEGKICCPESILRVGEKNINYDGCEMIIREYNNANDVKVEFTDNASFCTTSYKLFKEGKVGQKKRKTPSKNCVGEKAQMHNGEFCTIINSSRNAKGRQLVDVLFDNGIIRKGISKSAFDQRWISSDPRNYQQQRARSKEQKIKKLCDGEWHFAENGLRFKGCGICDKESESIRVVFEDGSFRTVTQRHFYSKQITSLMFDVKTTKKGYGYSKLHCVFKANDGRCFYSCIDDSTGRQEVLTPQDMIANYWEQIKNQTIQA